MKKKSSHDFSLMFQEENIFFIAKRMWVKNTWKKFQVSFASPYFSFQKEIDEKAIQESILLK